MPALKRYSLFISHAWRFEDYDRLVELLDKKRNFLWRDFSVPRYKPVIDTTSRSIRELRQALERQIRPTNCVLVIAGREFGHKHWLQTELEIASHFNKPLVAIIPRGQIIIPKIVKEYEPTFVHWNSHSIVDAIRSMAF